VEPELALAVRKVLKSLEGALGFRKKEGELWRTNDFAEKEEREEWREMESMVSFPLQLRCFDKREGKLGPREGN
jgi:hypothetical protein